MSTAGRTFRTVVVMVESGGMGVGRGAGVALLSAAGVAAALANFVEWPVAAGLGLVGGAVGWLGTAVLQRRADSERRETAWRATVTRGLGGEQKTSGYLAELLPERRVVPYSPLHASLLRQVVRWADGDGPPGERVLVVDGAPGSGKTRLLVEVAGAVRVHCGWVKPGQGVAAVLAAAALDSPAVLLIDDGDLRGDVDELLTALADADAPGVRIVISVRGPSPWWALVRERLPAYVLPLVPARAVLSVPEIAGGERERRQIFDKAFRCFAPLSDKPPPAAVVFAPDERPSMGQIHAAAALAALDDGRKTVFDLEQQWWRSTAERHGLHAVPDVVLRQVVVVAALVGAADAAAADTLLGCLPALTGAAAAGRRRAIAGWAREIYPQQAPDWLAPRLPGVLLEQHAAAALRTDDDLVTATAAIDSRAIRVITILGRAVRHSPDAEPAVRRLLVAGGYPATRAAVLAVALTGVPLDEEIAAVVDDLGPGWGGLRELLEVIPEQDRGTALASTTVATLRALLARGDSEAQGELAVVLLGQGHFAQAEAELAAHLAAQISSLGADHPHTRQTRRTLAGLLIDLGRYEQAEVALRAVLAGPGTDPLSTRRRLAQAIALQGRLREAEAELIALLADHPDPLSIRLDLAGVLAEQGQYERAEAELLAVLEAQTSRLGAEHRDTLQTRHSRGDLLREQGRFDLAEAELRAVAVARAALLGDEHPDTVATRYSLGNVLREQAQHAVAEAEFRAVLAAQVARLGADHPDSLRTRHSLAAVLREQDRLDPAEVEFRAVLTAQTRLLGAGHRDTLNTRNSLAAVLDSQGRHAEAETEFRQLLVTQTAVQGADHPYTLNTRKNLGVVLLHQARHDQAEAEFRAILPLLTAVLGPDHPDTASVRLAMAVVLSAQQQPERP